jgi:hypothetical protein
MGSVLAGEDEDGRETIHKWWSYIGEQLVSRPRALGLKVHQEPRPHVKVDLGLTEGLILQSDTRNLHFNRLPEGSCSRSFVNHPRKATSLDALDPQQDFLLCWVHSFVFFTQC